MARDDTEIVSAFYAALVDQVGEDRFELWFGSGARIELRRDQLLVLVPSEFTQQWLRTHFRQEIEAACRQAVGRPLPIEIRVDATIAVATDSTQKKSPSPDVAKNPAAKNPGASAATGARHRRKFAKLDEFVVGPCNKLAFTSAELAANHLGNFSPLLIHGPTGIGKTHLLEGIWCAAKKARPGTRAVFLSAEQFTSYFLEALRGSGLPSFRRKYRGVELLIIDDVHFFAGKRATLVELQHTVDTLMNEGRQLVFASDRAPADLEGLGPELRSRLSAGLVCSLAPPDYETRLGIIDHLARKSSLSVPLGVRKFVASRLGNHARELSGALNRLSAFSQAEKAPITQALAERALAEMIRHSVRPVSLREIDQAVCEIFGLAPRILQSATKSKAASYPRMLAMWLARKYTRSALSEIGSHFGGRSHSTVISAQKRVNTWRQAGEPLKLGDRDWNVDDAIRQVESQLRAG